MKITYRPRWCSECGDRFVPKRCDGRFCKDACRKAYHERRIRGGLRLYDAVMMWRIDRPQNALSKMTWLAENIVVEEREARARRKARIAEQRSAKESEMEAA